MTDLSIRLDEVVFLIGFTIAVLAALFLAEWIVTSFERRQIRKAMRDMAIYGTGFMKDGKHIPTKDVYK
jgi:hypothetical protein